MFVIFIGLHLRMCNNIGCVLPWVIMTSSLAYIFSDNTMIHNARKNVALVWVLHNSQPSDAGMCINTKL